MSYIGPHWRCLQCCQALLAEVPLWTVMLTVLDTLVHGPILTTLSAWTRCSSASQLSMSNQTFLPAFYEHHLSGYQARSDIMPFFHMKMSVNIQTDLRSPTTTLPAGACLERPCRHGFALSFQCLCLAYCCQHLLIYPRKTQMGSLWFTCSHCALG